MTSLNTDDESFTQVSRALQEHIRRVPDFPEPGVIFEDLTPVLADADAFQLVIDSLARAAQQYRPDIIGGLDARGFLLGSAVAYTLGMGIVAIRKAGKLPPPVLTQEYELEYGTAALEIPQAGIDINGKRVVLVDDVLATGGTLLAARSLLESAGAEVTGNVVILEVPALGGRAKLKGSPLTVIGSATA